ncbi:MAG TPA: hypothetical protein VGK29_21345 [Paludibaculum sp.]|jgi:hypothetical protein
MRTAIFALLSAAAFLMAPGAAAQNPPNLGLARHDFFFAGEQKQHWMFIVRAGKVEWSYIDANSKGEISDATLLPNGNVLFAYQYGVSLITPDGKILWHVDAPPNSEIHTAQMMDGDRAFYVQNGDPAVLRVVDTKSGRVEREFTLPVGNPKSVHGHFRHARLTPGGNFLVAHMDAKKVVEYDGVGAAVWSYSVESPWSAERLKNGNTLVTTNKKLVLEVDPQGRTVWQITADDAAGHKIDGFQIATRLPNGNTLVNNWVNQWSTTVDKANPPVQALEFTPDKKIVWVLSAWNDPADLGPATTIQLLDGVRAN